MTTDNKLIPAFIDLTPNWAKNEKLRRRFESELKERLIQQVPAMATRLAELEPIITTEVGGYTDFMMEATEAFMYGHWRSVVALIGIAAESFTDDLYSHVKWLQSRNGKQVSKVEVFGPDKYLPQQRKLAILRYFSLIDSTSYNKLIKIKKLRDLYVHPPDKVRDFEKDAREAMRLFRTVIKGRFDQAYTIKKGKIVRRKQD